MKNKSCILENNAREYLSFLSSERKTKAKMNNSNKFIKLNNIESNANNDTIDRAIEYLMERKNNSQPKCFTEMTFKNISAKNNNNNNSNNINGIFEEKKNFVPGFVKTKSSDITNPLFYDNIARQILLAKNKEIMKWNKMKSEYQYNSRNNKLSHSTESFPTAPGKSANPKYYDLGDSNLKDNPILFPRNCIISKGIDYYNLNGVKKKLASMY